MSSSATVWNPGADVLSVNADNTLLAQNFLITSDQDTFILTAFSYAIGTGSLLVFRNGQLINSSEVTELSTTSFKLASAIPAGEIVTALGFVGITATVGSIIGALFSQSPAYSTGTAGAKLQQVIDASDAPWYKSGGNTVANLVGITPVNAAARYECSAYYNSTPYNLPVRKSTYLWGATIPKSMHNGAIVISPTVPWDGTKATLANYLNGVGETSPGTLGCWYRIDNGTIDPLLFGANCDGTSDHVGIQACLVYAIANFISIVSSDVTYNLSQKVLIPNQNVFNKSINLDFTAARFNLLADVGVFCSAYYNAGVLTSNYGTTLMSYPSYGLRLSAFTITSSVGNTSAPALEIQDWYQGCYVGNIKSGDTERILNSNNNFYCDFDTIEVILNTVINAPGPCFYWEGNHNRNRFKNLLATNFDLQQSFNGPVIACTMPGLSVEGVVNGIEFNSDVDGLDIDGYFENFKRVFNFKAQSLSVRISSGYANFLNDATAYLVKHLPGPSNQIYIDRNALYLSAMPSERNIFETLDNTSGYNMMTVDKPTEFATFVDYLLVDNTQVSTEVTWKQVMNGAAGRAYKVNKFAVGNYSGMFSDGYNGRTFFQWINNSNSSLTIRTVINHNATQTVRVKIIVYYNSGTKYFSGIFDGDDFYEFNGTGLIKTTSLAISGALNTELYIISGAALPGLITDVKGEIRLL